MNLKCYDRCTSNPYVSYHSTTTNDDAFDACHSARILCFCGYFFQKSCLQNYVAIDLDLDVPTVSRGYSVESGFHSTIRLLNRYVSLFGRRRSVVLAFWLIFVFCWVVFFFRVVTQQLFNAKSLFFRLLKLFFIIQLQFWIFFNEINWIKLFCVDAIKWKTKSSRYKIRRHLF
jgi:hypothetical protein